MNQTKTSGLSQDARSRINQVAHHLAQRGFGRIRVELTALYEQLRGAGNSHEEAIQVIEKQAGKD